MAKGNGSFEQKVAAWMRGRNGADELSNLVLVLALLLVVVNVFARTFVLSVVSLLLMAYSWWRMSSKNIEAREKENRAFVRLVGPLRSWLRNPAASFAEARAYKHLDCPSCGQHVRVPRGKGKLRVTCPRCNEKFEART